MSVKITGGLRFYVSGSVTIRAQHKLDVSHQFVSLSDIKPEISKACAARMSNFGYMVMDGKADKN